MRSLGLLVIIMALAFGAWPYYHLWKLDRALRQSDRATLQVLIDLDAVRADQKQRLEQKVERSIGPDSTPIPGFVREGASRVLDMAVEHQVTLESIRDTLRWKEPRSDDAYPSIFTNLTYAFFERPTGFLVRIGDLGDDPVHVRMSMEGWRWRVTAVYG